MCLYSQSTQACNPYRQCKRRKKHEVNNGWSWLRPLACAAVCRLAYAPLPWVECLSSKSIWLVSIQNVFGLNPSWYRNFFCEFIPSLSLFLSPHGFLAWLMKLRKVNQHKHGGWDLYHRSSKYQAAMTDTNGALVFNLFAGIGACYITNSTFPSGGKEPAWTATGYSHGRSL